MTEHKEARKLAEKAYFTYLRAVAPGAEDYAASTIGLNAIAAVLSPLLEERDRLQRIATGEAAKADHLRKQLSAVSASLEAAEQRVTVLEGLLAVDADLGRALRRMRARHSNPIDNRPHEISHDRAPILEYFARIAATKEQPNGL